MCTPERNGDNRQCSRDAAREVKREGVRGGERFRGRLNKLSHFDNEATHKAARASSPEIHGRNRLVNRLWMI